MGEALEVAKVLVNPTIKLLDMVGGAIGTLYEPKHKRKMADATAYEIEVIGDAMRKAADLPIVYDQNGVAINSEDFARLMQRAGTRWALQETIKQHNIESVVDNAYDILEKGEYCSEDPVDSDWINSFFDSIANVSNEQMQIIWGRILAGEIKTPGCFSIRTLDTLRKMTQKEAMLFKKYAPYILQCMGNKEKTFYDYFLLDNMLGEFQEMVFPEILILHEAGLISLNGISITLFIEPNSTEYISGLSYDIEFKNTGDTNVAVSEEAFVLTESGKELYNVILSIGVEMPSEEYYDKCLEIISSKSFLDDKKWKSQVETKIVDRQALIVT